MELLTFAVLTSILFLGCVVGLGLSYDEEQLNLSQEEKNSRQLVDSFTVGQKAFLYVGFLSAFSAVASSSYLLFSSLGN